MNTREALSRAREQLGGHVGHTLDVFAISKPKTIDNAIELSKLLSKVSPLVGNLLELSIVELLNQNTAFGDFGRWTRQDPGFPDVIFDGSIKPRPGIEIKAWFPLATEITGRFKDSQNHFKDDHIDVALLAWLPEHLLYGRPTLLGACIVSGKSIAEARDRHYHNPPDYIILEPEDTTKRAKNLQQTNVLGYIWQGSDEERVEAMRIVESWGPRAKRHSATPEYQKRLAELTSKFKYRLETNFAKIDRIEHEEIETFKTRTLDADFKGLPISRWAAIISNGSDETKAEAFAKYLGIK